MGETGATRGLRARAMMAGIAAIVLVMAAACGGSSDNANGDDSESGTAGSEIEITGAWARVSPMMVDAGAAYMEITAGEADRLLSVSVDPSVAESAELHETVAVEDEMSSDDMNSDDSMDGDQAMTMRELADGLELPAGESVALAPGGYHIMLLGLAEPLVEGETFGLVLDFEKAETRTVAVEVRTAAP